MLVRDAIWQLFERRAAFLEDAIRLAATPEAKTMAETRRDECLRLQRDVANLIERVGS